MYDQDCVFFYCYITLFFLELDMLNFSLSTIYLREIIGYLKLKLDDNLIKKYFGFK